MARCINDVNCHILVMNGRIFREYRDTTFTFKVNAVEHPVSYLLIRTKHTALAKQRVDECRLAMIDVRNNGNVASGGRLGGSVHYSR
uniref:Uncharacterized protein n=1 Tax=uncultured marine group II/III euryarchaeote KM3_14_C07 TaxID=1457888 RepID=A0A075GDL5_9EURY|nr:hypothetical protein [uncultured marine group II/III euryarchaeote KM3_14_C07]